MRNDGAGQRAKHAADLVLGRIGARTDREGQQPRIRAEHTEDETTEPDVTATLDRSVRADEAALHLHRGLARAANYRSAAEHWNRRDEDFLIVYPHFRR